MDAFYAMYSVISGIILNPVMILLKHFILPKNEEEEVSNAIMVLVTCFLGISISVLINYLGNYDAPGITILALGLGVTGTSALTNVGTSFVINKAKTSP